MVEQGFLAEGLQKTSAGLGSVRYCTMHSSLLHRLSFQFHSSKGCHFYYLNHTHTNEMVVFTFCLNGDKPWHANKSMI